MEGARHSGRWNKKASFSTTLLLMCMFVPTLVSLQKTCPPGDYENDNGICCNKCLAGFKLVEKCQAEGQRSNCTQCPPGQYTAQVNFFRNCFRCKQCKAKHELVESECKPDSNTICRCEDGFYKYQIDSQTSECWTCKKCGPDEKEKQACTPNSNTVCECKVNYYKLSDKCVPCKNCTSECKNHCLPVKPTTEVPKSENRLLTNIIAGGVTVAIVLLAVASLITYMITKWLTKKKLQERTSQSSDVSSPESLEVLVQSEEPSDKGLKAIPQSPGSEQEPFNLPDCVPLEIKIPDLIYMVLDLVPVLQVKQLVRSLGVTDTDIERAEMDHRSCQEAHYQMLRVWAERGSRAGTGGRGGMLHRPLMLELLDKLRKMHLGQAAEELETKYGIQ